ncbi:MAG: HupE/UreJ family protein [Alphaproteobacteria bacterium]
MRHQHQVNRKRYLITFTVGSAMTQTVDNHPVVACGPRERIAHRPAALRRDGGGVRPILDGPAAIAVCLAIGLWLLPHFAHAHITRGDAGGFGSGFQHPLTGIDHFLAMFAVGLWGAQLGGRAVWSLPVAFPLIMVCGGVLGILGVSIPGVEIGIALSIIALGLAIAFAWRPAEWVALALIGVFAVFHGHAHGTELPASADPADYAIGFVVATGMVHLLGIGVGLALGKPFQGLLARVLGGLIALGGVYFLVA